MNRTFKSIMLVTFSNCTSILCGLFVGFLVPKMLTVEGYGLYKTFTLYMTYVGFFSLGIIDGIVLQYGGMDFEKIDRKKFRSLFRWYVLVHIVFTFLLIGISFFFRERGTRFIVITVALNMLAVNVSGYFQQLSQITQRFKEFAFRKILYNILNIIVVAAFFSISKRGQTINYTYYIVSIVAVNVALSIWYILTYREINFGKQLTLSDTKGEIFFLMKQGFPLLFANLLSTLILTIDRQFVNILYPTEIYAVYAFAYNMLAIVTVATSAISTVLYPTLKRTNSDSMRNKYGSLVGIILIVVFGAVACYYPLCIFVEWFLPKYIDSLPIFRIVFPGLALSSSITVVMHNYYKAEGKNIIYFKKSIIVLLISAIANAVAYVIFHTTYAISVASIITMIFWYIFVERYFIEKYGYKGKRNFIYIITMMILFYFASSFRNHFVGFILYLLLFVIFTCILQKNIIKNDLKRLLKR